MLLQQIADSGGGPSPWPDDNIFIVKIWLEETVPEAGCARWRGHITHVPDGRRHYFESLRALPLFIWPYLERSGACAPWHWRLWRWLAR